MPWGAEAGTISLDPQGNQFPWFLLLFLLLLLNQRLHQKARQVFAQMCPLLFNSLSSAIVQASSFYVMNYHNRLWTGPILSPLLLIPLQSISHKGPRVIFIQYKSECIIPLLATYQWLLFTLLTLAYESQHDRLLSFSSSTSHTVLHPSPCATSHWPSVSLEHIKLFPTLEPLSLIFPEISLPPLFAW